MRSDFSLRATCHGAPRRSFLLVALRVAGATLGVTWLLASVAQAQFMNSSAWAVPSVSAEQPSSVASAPMLSDSPLAPATAGAPAYLAPRVTPGRPFLNASYSARVAVVGDSARLANVNNLNFLPSAIPVSGQPFFGGPWRAAALGNGNLVDLAGAVESDNLGDFQAVTRLIVQDAALSGGANGFGSATIQQAFGQWNGLTFGLADTAFGNVDALPEVLDLAGPNARVTVLPAGTGTGQGRLSYTVFAPEDRTVGLTCIASLENPVPEIRTTQSTTPGNSTGTFARYPDLITSFKYSYGGMVNNKYVQTFNLQSASVFRSLGLENDTQTFNPTVFGWGESLSGAYWFAWSDYAPADDAVFFSATYGEGISHYLVDLRGSVPYGGGDAMVNTDGELVAVPVFGWYASYMHNWTEALRSTMTYSQVHLSSFDSPGQPVSPYKLGQFVQVNLVYHTALTVAFDPSKPASDHNFYTGVEYLFGQKETLDGAVGQDHRIMWVTSIAK